MLDGTATNHQFENVSTTFFKLVKILKQNQTRML